MENTQLNDIQLSPHFMLSEFLKLGKHPDNLPTPQVLFNMKYGCQYLLEPARREVGAIIVNSGYRNEVYNRQLVASATHSTCSDRLPTSAPRTRASSSAWSISSATAPIPTNC